jgi:hypothetical protein
VLVNERHTDPAYVSDKRREMLGECRLLTRGVKKTGEPEPELGNRKPGNLGPGSDSGLKKPKTGYPGSSTQFLVPGFYRVTENRVKYIYFILFLVKALHFFMFF